MLHFVNQLIGDTDSDSFERYKQATVGILFHDGRQWVDWSSKDRAWKDSPQVEGRIRVTMNYVRPILRARGTRLLSPNLQWRAVPHSNDQEERDRSTVATNHVQNRWDKTSMQKKVRYGLQLAFTTGVAALKQFWNPMIGSMVTATKVLPHPITGQPTEYPVDRMGNPIADESGNPRLDAPEAYQYRPGDTDTAVRSIFNLRLNPDAHGFDPTEGFRWLLDMDVLPLSVVRERWGDRAAKVQPQHMGAGPQARQYERIIRSLQLGTASGDFLLGRGAKDAPDKETTLYCEYWEEPTDLNKEGRLIIVAGGQVLWPLDAAEEGLPDGFVPFVPIYDERREFDGYGRPSVRDLIGPQKVINRQWSYILEDLARQGIGQWIMWQVPGLANQVGNLSGANIQIPMQSALANRSISDIVQRVEPGRVSPDRWHLIEQAKAAMFDIGAYHEIQRGQTPPGVDSGIALQHLQEQENAQLQDPVELLRESLTKWGLQHIRLARKRYGPEEVRWIPSQRPDLGYLIEGVHGSDLPDPDEIDLDLEGFRPTSQAAMRAEIKEFVEKGWMDPRQGLFLMDLGRGVEGAFETQTRHYSRARGENLAIERGQYLKIEHPEGSPIEGMPAIVHPDQTPFMLPADDDHMVHIAVHQEVALDDSRPWEHRQCALLHIAEHRMMMAMQMVEAAPQEPGAEQGSPSQGGKPQGASNGRGSPKAKPQ